MPGLVSCPRRLIVIGILTLSFVHINSEIWSNEVSDIQFGALGSSITLTCRDARRTSLVRWRQNGRLVQNSGSSLTLHNSTRSMEGNYSCYDQRDVLLQTVRLRLGHPPSHVNISCRVPNHFMIICSWMQRIVTYLPTKYISSYRGDGAVMMECEREISDVNQCTIHNPYFWSAKHVVNITEINPLGSMSTIAIVDIQKTLKPDAPEVVSYMEIEGQPTSLLVQLRPPASWPNDPISVFPLKFQLEYRPLGSRYWSKLETEETSVMITDALVGHMHLIRVRAQDAYINYSQWSEWSQVVQAQPWSDLTNTDEPTVDPAEVPVFPSMFPERTEKTPESLLEENGSLGLLVTLSLFAAVMVAVVSSITVLLWLRNRRRHNVTKQELTSMVKMKSLPI